MAGYNKQIWTDQNVERPRTYMMTNNSDGSVTLSDYFGTVTDEGTPVNAENMNHIEDGLENVALTKWNATITYNAGDWVLVDDKIYKSLQDNNTGNTVSKTYYWQNVELGSSSSGGGATGGGLVLTSTVTSTIPIQNEMLHLKDGAILQADGLYSEFFDYMVTKKQESDYAVRYYEWVSDSNSRVYYTKTENVTSDTVYYVMSLEGLLKEATFYDYGHYLSGNYIDNPENDRFVSEERWQAEKEEYNYTPCYVLRERGAKKATELFTTNGVDIVTPDGYLITQTSKSSDFSFNTPLEDTSEINLTFSLRTPSSWVANTDIFHAHYSFGIRVSNTSGALSVGLSSNGTSYDIADWVATNITLLTNTNYTFTFTYDGEKYLLNAHNNDNSTAEIFEYDLSTKLYAINGLFSTSSNCNPAGATYDLNSFDLNGQKLYEISTIAGSLRIPYHTTNICESLYNGVPLVVESYKSSTADTFYNIYSNGWIEQGGTSGTMRIGASSTVTLQYEMCDTNYHVVSTESGATGYDDSVVFNIQSTTQIQFSQSSSGANDGSGTKQSHYIARGFMKYPPDKTTFKDKNYYYLVVANGIVDDVVLSDYKAEIESFTNTSLETLSTTTDNGVTTVEVKAKEKSDDLEAQYKLYLESLAQYKSSALTYKHPRYIYADKNTLTMYAGTVIRLTNDELFTAGNDLTMNISDILDTETTSNGEDYYFYINDDKNFVCTKTETTESGLTLIGGAHTLCVGVTEENAPDLCDDSFWDTHPAIGYNAGHFIPNSTWTPVFKSTAKTGNKGMAYIEYPGIQPFWVDIYLQSGTGAATMSSYAGTVTDNRQCILHEWDMKLVGKKLPCDYQFMTFAEGSNNKTSISGAAVPSDKLTGGYYDTAGKRMISGYFIECCCGYLWQWGDEIAPDGGSSWSAYGQTTRGGSYGMPYVLRFGGCYGDSTNCGSWSRCSSDTRSYAAADNGARGVSFHYELAV